MRGRYHTERREEVLDFLGSLERNYASAADIYSALQQAGSDISRATVYRQINHLVEEGLVLRFTPEGEQRACYQLADGCRKQHYHLKCEKCGKLIHLNCDEVDTLLSHLLADHRFYVDTGRTVFYGICDDCKSRK